MAAPRISISNGCRSAPARVNPANEGLTSSLENFITEFFGTVTKTVVDGRVVWALPCDLDEGITGFPRVQGEGLACYFLRVFETLNELNGIAVSGTDGVEVNSNEISLGNITPVSVAASSTVTGSNLSGINTGDQDLSGKEDSLGDPAEDGYLLSSTAAGARTWVPAPSTGITWAAMPSSSASAGTAGQVAYDGFYFAVCVATDTWLFTALSER